MANKIKPAARGRPRQFDEQDVLQRAAQIFLRDGFESASYEHIADALELSKPSLYNTFGDKTALFERVVGHYATYVRERIVSQFSGAQSLHTAAQQLFRAAAQYFSRPDQASIGCLLIGTALPAASSNHSIRTTLSDFTMALEAALEAVIVEQYEKDVALLGTTARDVAVHISSLIFALAVRARMGLSREQLLDFAANLAALVSRVSATRDSATTP